MAMAESERNAYEVGAIFDDLVKTNERLTGEVVALRRQVSEMDKLLSALAMQFVKFHEWIGGQIATQRPEPAEADDWWKGNGGSPY